MVQCSMPVVVLNYNTYIYNMKKVILSAVLLLSFVAVPAKDLKKLVLSTGNQMHCQKCEKKVTENLRYVAGVKSIKAEASNQTITIVYDADKTKPEAFVKSLQKIKYVVDVKSDEAYVEEKKK